MVAAGTYDGAEPSVTSVAVHNLLRLAALTDDDKMYKQAERILASVLQVQHPLRDARQPDPVVCAVISAYHALVMCMVRVVDGGGRTPRRHTRHPSCCRPCSTTGTRSGRSSSPARQVRRTPQGHAGLPIALAHPRADRLVCCHDATGAQDTQALLDVVHGRFLPDSIVIRRGPSADDPEALSLFSPTVRMCGLVQGMAAARTCQARVCSPPVIEADTLRDRLAAPPRKRPGAQ